MRIRTAAAAAVVALLAVGSTACSSSTGSSKWSAAPSSAATAPQAPAAAAPTAPPAPAGTTTAAPAGAKPSGPPPRPDAATTAAYIAALTAIDPEIVSDKVDRAVSRGRDQCTSVAQSPGDQAGLVALANRRFTSAKHPDGFGPEKSAKILEVVRKHLCPTY
ncbi:hypothetical protein GCM10018790_64090 [Kitasatospora xanthocidica]|uniref:hypothetical protein n=1 Tax=Kitasatospora xanthocidica TaxID=83382 RepID=UPI001678C11F|nr:hypothetical protein [Kitasatospora xanthocidica]GHF77163.1 hypothetical protein GCM10018790_64090 [Kitasatospora xanthocidica]